MTSVKGSSLACFSKKHPLTRIQGQTWAGHKPHLCWSGGLCVGH